MKCPFCNGKTRVIDARDNKRRRECLSFGTRFNTAEVVTTGPGSHPSSGSRGYIPKRVKKPKPKPRVKVTKVENADPIVELEYEPEFHEATDTKTLAGKIQDVIEARKAEKDDWYD